MEVPITQFRRDLFDLANRALKGEPVSLTYRGERLRLVPETAPATNFEHVPPLQVVNPNYRGGLRAAKRQIMSEMEAEWEKDWSEL